MVDLRVSDQEAMSISSALMYRAELLDYAIARGDFDGLPSSHETEARVLRDKWRELARKVAAQS